MDPFFDVLVIGSGVVGCAVARELSRYCLSVGVLEKLPDLGCETSARNSGVLHAGFNNKPGSLMARLCVEGNGGFDEIARELDVPFARTGKLVVGFTPDDRQQLLALIKTGNENGVPGLQIVGKDRIRRLAPHVLGEFAMWSPTTGILNPFQYTLALAENAAHNGAQFFFDREVTGIEARGGRYFVRTAGGVFCSRWVVNCAGLGSARVSSMLGIDDYTV
jgi:glycerol-3-phosphate dehydrogenase